MSAFAVYGVSRSQCLEVARKNTRHRLGATEAEWEADVQRHYETLLTRSQSRISQTFDAPQFAKEWIEAGHATGDLLPGAQIYCLIRTKDPKAKRGYTQAWVPWSEDVMARAERDSLFA